MGVRDCACVTVRVRVGVGGWVLPARAGAQLTVVRVSPHRTAKKVDESRVAVASASPEAQRVLKLRRERRALDAAAAQHRQATLRLQAPLAALRYGMPRGDLPQHLSHANLLAASQHSHNMSPMSPTRQSKAGGATPRSAASGASGWELGGSDQVSPRDSAELVVVLDCGDGVEVRGGVTCVGAGAHALPP